MNEVIIIVRMSIESIKAVYRNLVENFYYWCVFPTIPNEFFDYICERRKKQSLSFEIGQLVR